MKVKAIWIKRETESRRDRIQEGYFKEKVGLLGDSKGKGGNRQVAILSFKDRKYIEENPTRAICMNRFHENITIEGLEASDLNVEDKIEIGETIQEITSIGKTCFAECILYKNKEICPLIYGVVFTRVLKSGAIKVGDDAIILKK